jgi:hypothetical protein
MMIVISREVKMQEADEATRSGVSTSVMRCSY